MRRNWLPLLGTILLLTSLACNLPGIGDRTQETPVDPTAIPSDQDTQDPAVGDAATIPADETLEFSPEQLEAAFSAPVVDDRPEVLSFLGQPDAFTISIVAVEDTEVRMESWRYYQFGTRVDFVDGEAALTIEIAPAPDGAIFPAWFDPLAFRAGMTAAEAAGVAADASPAGAQVESIDLAPGGEDLAGGQFFVGDQIVIGIQNDRLVYVETVGLFSEGGE